MKIATSFYFTVHTICMQLYSCWFPIWLFGSVLPQPSSPALVPTIPLLSIYDTICRQIAPANPYDCRSIPHSFAIIIKPTATMLQNHLSGTQEYSCYTSGNFRNLLPFDRSMFHVQANMASCVLHKQKRFCLTKTTCPLAFGSRIDFLQSRKSMWALQSRSPYMWVI